jgi:FkbM family methyltransferase
MPAKTSAKPAAAAETAPPWVFDMGCHKGEDTSFYLAKGYRVAAFEANSALVEALKTRFAEAIEAGRLKIYAGILKADARPGEKMRFFVNKGQTNWGTADEAWMERNRSLGAASDIVELDTVNLETVMKEIGVPCYAKIDIQGLDYGILNAFKSFDERPRFLSVASDKVRFEGVVAEVELLQELGYKRFQAVQQRWIPGSTIETTKVDGEPLRHEFEMHSSGPFGEDLKGAWVGADELIAQYRPIFRDYRLFGDHSWLQRVFGRAPMAILERLTHRPMPGWYDTHARID